MRFHISVVLADGLIGQGTFTLSNGPQRVLLLNKKGTEQGQYLLQNCLTKSTDVAVPFPHLPYSAFWLLQVRLCSVCLVELDLA